MLLFPYPELHDSWQCCFGLALFAGTENNMLSLRMNLATGVAVNFYGNWKNPTSTQNNIPAKVRANPPKAKNKIERGRGGTSFSGAPVGTLGAQSRFSLEAYEKAPSNSDDNIGNQMVRKIGWTGSGGIGKDGQGRAEPVMALGTDGKFGLGCNPTQGTEVSKKYVFEILLS